MQVSITSGLPAFTVVGLPDKAVGESRERVRAALAAMGLALPPRRITVNLAPADLLKEGSHFDLPIALGLLGVMGVLPAEEIEAYVAMGELSLDGSLLPVAGVLPAAMAALKGARGFLCPAACGGEAAWAHGLEVLAAPSLLALVNHFKGTQVLSPPVPRLAEPEPSALDLKDVKGQETAKRALEVAAAGGHNLLMIGPPGSGKSMLAARLPGLLPPLDPTEALEVSVIHSVAGMLREGRLMRQRPYRDPHHSASLPALVGGGVRGRPGEVSLAHLGVLFLDELPEFQRATLEERCRQPLEAGRVNVARVNAHVTYPARVQLVAAMNPCRCGHLDDPALACGRAPKCVTDYQGRISGPLFDRIDLHVEGAGGEGGGPVRIPPPPPKARPRWPAGSPPRAKSSACRFRVAAARAARVRTNAEADGALLDEIAAPEADGRRLLTEAAERLKLSARRDYHRVLRVARTLADLDASPGVRRIHIAEALSYRRILLGADLRG